MILSAKARRLVARSVADLPDAEARDVWGAFERESARDLPLPVARVALRALESAERNIAERLVAGRLDEDEQADLTNDLYFIRAVESDLRRNL